MPLEQIELGRPFIRTITRDSGTLDTSLCIADDVYPDGLSHHYLIAQHVQYSDGARERRFTCAGYVETVRWPGDVTGWPNVTMRYATDDDMHAMLSGSDAHGPAARWIDAWCKLAAPEHASRLRAAVTAH